MLTHRKRRPAWLPFYDQGYFFFVLFHTFFTSFYSIDDIAVWCDAFLILVCKVCGGGTSGWGQMWYIRSKDTQEPQNFRWGDGMIQFDHVNVIREKRKILNDINWHAKKGEHWAILGLNGSGKTTLLQLLNGYLAALAANWSCWARLLGRLPSRVAQTWIHFGQLGAGNSWIPATSPNTSSWAANSLR